MPPPIPNPKSAIRNRQSRHRALPSRLRPLFWDTDFRHLRWPRHRDFVIARVLQSGRWEDIQWLRARIGDRRLRAWIIRRKGRGLSGRELRFWELVLHLPRRSVNRWLQAPALRIWEGRIRA